MKRVGFLYEKVYDVENIKLAIKNASKGKRKRRYVRRVLKNADYYAEKLSRELREKTYKLSPNRHKTIYDESSNKYRDITIPQFYPDQVIQWALIQVVRPHLLKSMYRHSCAAIPGRGIEDARKYVEKVARLPGKKYVLKMDLKKFFPSISTAKIKQQLRRKFKDNDLLELFDRILDNGGEGLPIGYYSSQWLSNTFLDEVDRFIKEECGIKWYCRYADDLVLVDTDKQKLHNARAALEKFLTEENYQISIKQNWQVYPLSARPIDFVGYRFYENRAELRKKMVSRIKKTTYKIEQKNLNIRSARRLNSLFGWACHSDFKNQYLKTIKPVASQKTLRRYIGVYYRRHSRSGENKIW